MVVDYFFGILLSGGRVPCVGVGVGVGVDGSMGVDVVGVSRWLWIR